MTGALNFEHPEYDIPDYGVHNFCKTKRNVIAVCL